MKMDIDGKGKDDKLDPHHKKKKMGKEKEKEEKEKKNKDEKAKGRKELRPDRTQRKRKQSDRKSYAYYIHKVLRTVHPGAGSDVDGKPLKCTLSVKAMTICDNLVTDIYTRLAREAIQLCRKNKKRTLSSIEIQTAVRLALPGELAKHAIGDGTKAVTNFQQQRGEAH